MAVMTHAPLARRVDVKSERLSTQHKNGGDDTRTTTAHTQTTAEENKSDCIDEK